MCASKGPALALVCLVLVVSFAACAPAPEEVLVEEPDTTEGDTEEVLVEEPDTTEGDTEEVLVEEPDTTEGDTEEISQVAHVSITGRVVVEDGTPWPGVNLYVGEFKEGQCVILFLKESGPHAETDRTGRVELVVERAYLEGYKNGFCLEIQMPGELGPQWAVVGAEKDASGRHKVHTSNRATLAKLEEGITLAIDEEDDPLVFRVPETENVMELGEVYGPGKIVNRS